MTTLRSLVLGCGPLLDGALVLLALLLLGAPRPHFSAAPRRANLRACFANQHSLAAAQEMDALDHGRAAPELAPATQDRLRELGYLQQPLACPGAGTAGLWAYASREGRVHCLRHGGSPRGWPVGAAPGPHPRPAQALAARGAPEAVVAEVAARVAADTWRERSPARAWYSPGPCGCVRTPNCKGMCRDQKVAVALALGLFGAVLLRRRRAGVSPPRPGR